MSWVTVRLAPDGDGDAARRSSTSCTPRIVDEHWTQFGPGAVGVGWDLGSSASRRHIATGDGRSTTRRPRLVGVDEGKAFMRASGEAWARRARRAAAKPATRRARDGGADRPRSTRGRS